VRSFAAGGKKREGLSYPATAPHVFSGMQVDRLVRNFLFDLENGAIVMYTHRLNRTLRLVCSFYRERVKQAGKGARKTERRGIRR